MPNRLTRPEEMMTLRLNGETRTFEEKEDCGLVTLLEELGFGDRPVLVEHNGVALHQREHAEVTVRDGDALEIILIVAGG